MDYISTPLSRVRTSTSWTPGAKQRGRVHPGRPGFAWIPPPVTRRSTGVRSVLYRGSNQNSTAFRKT